MLGNKFMERSGSIMTEEAKKQFDIAFEAVEKLSETDGKCWGVMTRALFDHVRLICFAQGAAVAAGVIGICALVRKSKDEQKNKTE